MTEARPNPFINPEQSSRPYQLPGFPFTSMGDARALSRAEEASGILAEVGFLGSDELVERVAGYLFAKDLIAASKRLGDYREDLHLPIPEGSLDELNPRELVIGLAALYAWNDENLN